MKVWLDDERPMPADYDVHVKTADEAIALLQTNKVTLISLDHDLGLGKTGYHVAQWIEEHAANGTLKELCSRVHTQNPIGEKNIKYALRNAHHYWMRNEIIAEILNSNLPIKEALEQAYDAGFQLKGKLNEN